MENISVFAHVMEMEEVVEEEGQVGVRWSDNGVWCMSSASYTSWDERNGDCRKLGGSWDFLFPLGVNDGNVIQALQHFHFHNRVISRNVLFPHLRKSSKKA